MDPVRVVVDTDGGVDDCVALWWALTDRRVDVAAVVVTAGNVDRDQAATNVLRVLAAAGRGEVPVALGASAPIGPTPVPGRATFIHGTDGLGGHGHRWTTGGLAPVGEPATEMLARITADHPGVLHLVTIGPLSTVAQALDADPGLAGRVASLVVMGGVVARPGNALPLGEFNIAQDPEAAATVVAAAWPALPLLVGLDVTLTCLLGPDELAHTVAEQTPAAAFLAGPVSEYAQFYRRSRQTPAGQFTCHDLLAVLAAVDPSVITEGPVLPLAIDTGGSAGWGATVADRRATPQHTPPGFHPWRVALGADQAAFRTAYRSML